MKILSRIKPLIKNPRVSGVLSMTGGSLFAQLLTIGILPILSRLYSPSDFGILSIVMAISGIIAPAVALKFDTVVLFPRSKRRTRAVVSVALLTTLTIALIWASLSELIAVVFFTGQSPPFLGLWVFGITLLTGLYSLFSQLALRERRYGQVASRTALQSVGTAGGQTLFGLFSWGHTGLLIGALLGKTVGIIKLATIGKNYLGRHQFGDMLTPFRDYWRFPVVFAPSAVLNSLGAQLPLISLTALYGVEFAGQLGMAERVVSLPILLLGTAIGQMFIAELTKMRRDNKRTYLRFFFQLSVFLAGISIVGFGTLALIAHWLIPWALGNEWTSTAALVQILALTGGIRLIAIPLARAISVFQRAGANIAIDVTRVVLMVGAIYIVFNYSMPVTTAVWLIYGTLAIVYLITWVYVLFLLRRETKVNLSPLDLD